MDFILKQDVFAVKLRPRLGGNMDAWSILWA